MRTYPLIDPESGIKYAFEIENVYISPSQIGALLTETDDVSDVRKRRLFGPNPEIHVSFRYAGLDYIVWEPYGDNSRYWVGPKEKTRSNVNIAPIENAFLEYRPPLIRRAIGNLLTLRFLPRRANDHLVD